MSLQQAAEHFSVSEKTLRRFTARKEIPAYRLGRQIRVRISELEAAMVPMGSAAR